MVRKLEHTFLSRKLKPESLWLASGVFLFLLFLQLFDLHDYSASGKTVFSDHQYWRIFASEFLHGDLNHLGHNAFFFTGLAFLLNSYFGFWTFPVFSLILGGFVNLITISFYSPDTTLVGISGVVYLMASFWLTMFILIERRFSMGKRLIYAVGMSLIFFFPETFQSETSYLAHGVGFALGIPWAFTYFIVNRGRICASEEWVEKKERPIDFDWDEMPRSELMSKVSKETPGHDGITE